MTSIEFRLNGVHHQVTTEEALGRIRAAIPDQVRTHWVEIDGERWPAKQALEAVIGVSRNEFVSHTAVRILAALGFMTSPLPRAQGSQQGKVMVAVPSESARARVTSEEAVDAFKMLDHFFQASSLTATLAQLESELDQADQHDAKVVAEHTGLDLGLVQAALVVRERVGMLDSLIHAGIITQVLPLILEPGETIAVRPSLGAGNDTRRVFDLETDRRVAEFKVAQWKGADSFRQRGLVADLAGLALDQSGRRRQLFIVGERPRHFLTTSNRKVVDLLSKSALRLRGTKVLAPDLTVKELTELSDVEIFDLSQWIPGL